MTDQHPLTDQVIHREFLPKFCYRENDLRAAYDKGMEDRLKQVRQAWDQVQYEPGDNIRYDIKMIRRFWQKLDEMHPQENN